MTYPIEITETLQRTVTVEADTLEQALSKVKAAYADGSIVLDVDDMVGPPAFGWLEEKTKRVNKREQSGRGR